MFLKLLCELFDHIYLVCSASAVLKCFCLFNSCHFVLGKKFKQSKDGFLSEAELAYWSEHLKVDESEIPRMPESTEVLSVIAKVSERGGGEGG